MHDIAYRRHRQRNNEAARKSRESSKRRRSQQRWVFYHPDLDDVQRQDASLFLLDGQIVPKDRETRTVVRQHLIAARAVSRDRYRRLLGLLDTADASKTNQPDPLGR